MDALHRPLPDRRPGLLPQADAQVRHPRHRCAHHAVLVRGLRRPRRLPVGAQRVSRQRVREREGGRGVWGFRLVSGIYLWIWEERRLRL